ncbi:MAG: hypothetical protein WD492_13440 [Alkalispirochaeta sp.]
MQRRIVYGIAVALLTMGLVTAPAQSRSDVTNALEDEGYTVREEYSDGGVPSWRLSDSQDRRFSVSVMGRFSSAHAEALDAMREVIYEIDGLEIDRLRYVFESDRADAVVIPSEFLIDGADYVQYMPSGMQFEFDDAVRFDFRLLVDNLAVRMNGQFLSEAQFLDRIQRAVENPANYIQSQDPQYLAQQIVDLRQRMERRVAVDIEQNNRDESILSRVESLRRESENAITAVTEKNEQAVNRLQERNEQALNRLQESGEQAVNRLQESGEQAVNRLQESGEQAVNRLQESGEQAVNRLEAQISQLAEQQAHLMAEMAEQFEAQLQAVREEKAELQTEFEALRRGSIILAGRTLFGNLRDVDPEALLQVVQIRAANPQITQDEVQERVNADLPDDAEPLHNRHIQAIYALYFNQYE